METDVQVKEKSVRYTSYQPETPETNVDENPGGFMIRDVLRFFAVDIILMFGLRLLVGLGFFQTPDAYVLSILGSKVILFIYLFWLIRDRRDAWPETGATTAGRWWAWPAAIVIYAGCYPLLIYADRFNHMLMEVVYSYLNMPYPEAQDVLVLIFSDIVDLPVRLLLVFFTIFIGPFVEELAFRGMGLDACRRAWGLGWSVFWTSLLFGLYHFSFASLLPLSLLGALFALIRIMSRTLWCAVLIHCIHNAVTIVIVARALGAWEQLKFW